MRASALLRNITCNMNPRRRLAGGPFNDEANYRPVSLATIGARVLLVTATNCA
jgi:hypothetical protein